METLQTNKFYQGDVIEVLKTFPNECVDCIVTSPPYYAIIRIWHRINSAGLFKALIGGHLNRFGIDSGFTKNTLRRNEPPTRLQSNSASPKRQFSFGFVSTKYRDEKCPQSENSKNGDCAVLKMECSVSSATKIQIGMGDTRRRDSRFTLARHGKNWLKQFSNETVTSAKNEKSGITLAIGW